MHRMSSVRATLCQRHCVHTNLARDSFRQHELPLPCEGLANLQRCEHAKLDITGQQPVLIVRDLRSGNVEHRWLLPSLAGFEASHTWRWGSQTLAMPYGWELESEASLLLVDPASGQCRHVRLWPGAQAEPEQSMTRLTAWSSAGFLLAWHSPSGRCCLVGAAAGRLAGKTVLPGELADWPWPVVKWAPNGCAVLLAGSGFPGFWLWEVGQDAPTCHDTGAFRLGHASWSPDSTQLLLADSTGSRALAWSVHGSCVQGITGDRMGCPVWGSHDRVALLRQRRGINIDGMSSEAYKSGSLHTADTDGKLISRWGWRTGPCVHADTLALAPDCLKFAVGTFPPQACDSTTFDCARGAAVVDLQGRWRLDTTLPPSCTVSRLQWAPDSSCLLISDDDGHQLLLEFD